MANINSYYVYVDDDVVVRYVIIIIDRVDRRQKIQYILRQYMYV